MSLIITKFLGLLGLIFLLIYIYRLCDEEHVVENFNNSVDNVTKVEISPLGEALGCNILKGCGQQKPVITKNLVESLNVKRNINKFVDDELNFPVMSIRKFKTKRCRHC